MSFSVLWIALPKERVGGRAKLSLVASPRMEGPVTKFGANPLADWPAIVTALGRTLNVATKGSTELRPATVTSAAPNSALWKALFGPATPVNPTRGAGRAALAAALPGPVFSQAAQGLEALYRQASATEAMRRDHPVAQTLAALADPRVTAVAPTPEAVAREATRLRTQGGEALATALPIAAYATALRDASTAQAPAATGPLDGIRPIHQAEFHQVVSLLLDHPTLALALGLRVDIECEAFTDARMIRVVGADGKPLNGPIVRSQPWSSISPSFTMAARPGDEVAEGMLDLRSGFVTTTVDVAGLVNQLGGLLDGRDEVHLPVVRDHGITVSQPNRAARAVRGVQTAAAFDVPGQEPILFADDVTTGYRVDVARNRGPFRSLMRRRVRYTVGREVITAEDEGKVEAMVAAQQLDGDGVPQLRIGEEVIDWNGWSAVAPKPGPKVASGVGTDQVTEIEPALVPGYDLKAEIAAGNGSLPRLRFGSEYELRARAVDLAGNSPAPAPTDRGRALPPLKYLRREAAPSPALLPRRRFIEGESLNTLVVRAGDPPCERHLIPPKASYELAERHGLFDEAFGPRATQAGRDRLLAVAGREAGSLLDVGQVVSTDPARTPARPVTRGDALPNGAYVIRDADTVDTPYLADPIVAGVALHGLPGGVVTLAFGGTWPDLKPGRLVIEAKADGPPQARVTTEGGRPVMRVALPPGFDGRLTLSSTIAEARVGELDLGNATREEVLQGRALNLSAPLPLRVVHAATRPSAAPVLEDLEVRSSAGRASAEVRALVTCDRATTGRVDLEAAWTEVTDPGTGPLDTADLRVTVGSQLVEPGSGVVKVAATQHLGDRKHREIRYRPTAATRFREFLPRGDAGSRPAAAEETVQIPNRIRPARPQVHAVVPTFRWTRKTVNGVVTSVRETAGLRVWLKRRWLETGAGELLGVVIPATPEAGIAADGRDQLLRDLLTRWGGDPLEESAPAPPGHLSEARFGNAVHSDLLNLIDPGVVTEEAVRVVGHEVHFDAQRGLWYADVDLDVPETAWPFVRLALVRYQPESVAGCHVSPVVVTDFTQLPPRRAITARRNGTFGVRVTVRGPAQRQSRFTMRQERRIPEPLVTSLDLGSDDGVGLDNGWHLRVEPPRSGVLAELVFDWAGSAPPPAALVAELRAGRVVVEERQPGWALLGPEGDERVTYTETFDRAAVGMGS